MSSDTFNLPSSFIDFIKDNNIPVPPLPLESINYIDEYYENVFATDPRDLLESFYDLSISDTELLFDNNSSSVKNNMSDINYILCGIIGSGIQSWNFVYAISRKNLDLIISLPFGNLYNDREKELEDIKIALMFATVCQNAVSKDNKIKVVLDSERCHWQVYNDSNELLSEAKDVSSLLNYFEKDDIKNCISLLA